LELTLRVLPDVPDAIVGDPHRAAADASLNLIGNAVKFTKTGEVTVEVARSVNARRNRSVVALRRHRYGHRHRAGKPGETVFQAFEQVDGSTTREYGGTGLGLAITRATGRRSWVAEVEIESEAGKGSTFQLHRALRPWNSTAVK
jgi:signal transduction histidine kinase